MWKVQWFYPTIWVTPRIEKTSNNIYYSIATSTVSETKALISGHYEKYFTILYVTGFFENPIPNHTLEECF